MNRLANKATKTQRLTQSRDTNIKSVDAPVASDTDARLLAAAAAEFNERGFAGTDTNRIARRAGFAPQTFYRWFKDKTAIFIAVYRAWEDIESAMMSELLAQKATTKQLIDAVVAHHGNYKIFRRSLRQLSLDDADIRRARAESRKRQIARLQTWQREFEEANAVNEGVLAAALLQMERLADALAEGELEDMGLSPVAAQRALADIVEKLRTR